jgi:hypothetical protein
MNSEKNKKIIKCVNEYNISQLNKESETEDDLIVEVEERKMLKE